MLTIEQLATHWNSMSEEDRVLYWNDFTEMLDVGEAGYHRYYLLLMPIWAGEETAATAELKMPEGALLNRYKPFHFTHRLAA